MKQFLRGMLLLISGATLLSALWADDASTRYSYSASRGPWPANGEVANGGGGDTRYITTPLQMTDIKTLSELQGSNKIIAMLMTGWDWCEVGSRILADTWRQGFGDNYVTTVYDWPETEYVLTEGDNAGTDISTLSRSNDYAGTLFPLGGTFSRAQVWPAIALYDSDGKLFALERGVDYMDNATLKAKMDAWVENYNKYLAVKAEVEAATDETLATAATNGDMGLTTVDGVIQDAGGRTITLSIYKAALLANALVHLEKNIYNLAYMDSTVCRKTDFDTIRSLDPNDVSGAIRRVKTVDLYSQGVAYSTTATDELKDSLATLIDDTRLVKYSDNEYQQALLCGYNMYRASSDLTTAEVYARRAIEKNPASFWGEGARGHMLLKTGIGPVTIGRGWKAYHLAVPAAIEAADGTDSFTSEEIAAQDGLTIDDTAKTFKWTMRYGNDRFITYQGWHSFKMAMNSSGANEFTINSIKIWMDTASKDDPSTGTLIFDGTAATNVEPTNGDDMATFTEVTFPKGVNPSVPLSFNFYVPKKVARLFPHHEKDWTDKPKYNDVAIEITGTYTGTSSGTITVAPILIATATEAPNATQITIDENTLNITDALDTLQETLESKEPAEGTKGETVADEVYALLTATDEDGNEANTDYINALTRANFFYEHQSAEGFEGKIAEVAANDQDGVEMLNALLADRTWLTDLMVSGPSCTESAARPRSGGTQGTAEDALHRVCTVWRTDKIYCATNPTTRRGAMAAGPSEEKYDAILRRMAVIGALSAAPTDNGNLGQTHWLYRAQMDAGALHGDFYTQSAAQMRYSMNPQLCHVLELEHAANTGSTRINYINGTAWQTSYLMKNFFNDSIFGSDYFAPWTETVMPGTAMGREIGAVCGGISYYGVLAANATGRRSIPGGQPGHCAATHRTFDGSFWEIDSNVGSPTGSHYPLWSNYTYQAQEYYDDMWDDPKTLIGYRLLWAARLRALRYGETDPGVEALYFRAIQEGPLCYQAYLDSRDFLKANYPNDADRWLRWAECVTNGLWRYPSVGWGLLNANMLVPLKAQYGYEATLATFKQLHVRMHDSDRKTREMYNYTSTTVATHASYFTDDEDFISLLGTAMDARYGTGRFTNLVNWANSRYPSGDLGNLYQTMLQSVYEANGNPLGVKATCLESLLEASKDGNLSSFREMCSLYINLFQDSSPYPELSTDDPLFTQDMLSADGMVTMSSYPELDLSGDVDALHTSAEAFCHLQRLIDNSAFGTYSAWTQEQYDDAWMMVQMPGDVEVFGVVVQNAEGTMPLTVEISSDATTWTTLVAGRNVEAGGTLSVSFDGSQVSRYIRVRYANTSGTAVRLKLNKIQVFARKRY